jgi:putative ABC transport system permease protein
MLMPVTTASKRLFNRDYLTGVTVQLNDPSKFDAARDAITALLRERHGIVPPVEDNFTISNPRAAVESVEEVGSTLSSILTGVGAIATLIGGVVIMTLMLMAVAERRREIGVRRALGATQRDVLRQFLAESAVIACLGGIVGVAAGVAIAAVVAAQRDLPPVLLWQVMLGAVGVSAVIGIVFGLQPAWRAARVDPIEALRA